MDRLSPKIWSPWTNGLQPSVPLDKWSLEYSICPWGQAVGIRKYGDRIGWGPFVHGDQSFGDHLSVGTEFVGDHLSRGINFIGIVCPGGQSVRDRKYWDQMDLGPNASQSIFYHPKIKQFFEVGMLFIHASSNAYISLRYFLFLQFAQGTFKYLTENSSFCKQFEL